MINLLGHSITNSRRIQFLNTKKLVFNDLAVIK
jgi:hypothetical protein